MCQRRSSPHAFKTITPCLHDIALQASRHTSRRSRAHHACSAAGGGGHASAHKSHRKRNSSGRPAKVGEARFVKHKPSLAPPPRALRFFEQPSRLDLHFLVPRVLFSLRPRAAHLVPTSTSSLWPRPPAPPLRRLEVLRRTTLHRRASRACS